MCVICVKPKSKVIPIDYLKKMFNTEPHGAGFGISLGDRVYFEKGFMEFEDFLKAFEKWNVEKYTAVVHFRTASVGSIKPELTHPFPLTNEQEELLSLKGFAGSILFHNGTVSSIETSNDLSDTAELAKMLGYFKKKYDMAIDDLSKILESVAPYNKFVIQTGNEIYLIGCFHEKDGLYFSNLSWDFSYTYTYSYGYGWRWRNSNSKKKKGIEKEDKGIEKEDKGIEKEDKGNDYWLWRDYNDMF